MSFDRLSSLESQPTTARRQDDATYRDDPEFTRLSESLSTRLFELTTNISRLSNQIALLGTKRDTQRVRERVHDLLEETRDGFKDVGEGIKKVQGWDDLNVNPIDTPHSNLQPEFLGYQYNGFQVKLIPSQGWLLLRLQQSADRGGIHKGKCRSVSRRNRGQY